MSSESILGFGLLKVYSTDNPVILRADEAPYYGNVTKFIGVDMVFAAKIKSGYTGALPYGTLTNSDAARYTLTPQTPSGDYALYNVSGGVDIANFAGQKVTWNVYTSPKAIVGAVQIPEEISSYSMDVATGSVVPYVKINHESTGSTTISRVDLYFVNSGDTTYTSVALGDTTVSVYLDSSSISGGTPAYQFTNFNKAVRNSFSINGMYEGSFFSMTVEYIKDGAKYIWNFVRKNQDAADDIDFGELALSDQPFTLEAGDSSDILIEIPGRYDLSSYSASDFVSVGNVDVLAVDSLSFDQGTADWNGADWVETYSTLSLDLTGLAMGRTTIRINLPDIGTYIREVRVTSGDGTFELSGDVPSGVSMPLTGHTTKATFVNGKPWYPSAEDYGDTYSFVLSGSDLPDSGYFGITYGAISELHTMSVDKESGSSKTYSMLDGIFYDTENSENNSEGYTLDIDDYTIKNATVWAEFPDNPNFNVVSASLKSLVVSADYMTTAEQLETLAPYFEMYDFNDTNYTVSLDWSFVNPKTMEKVTDGISNVKIKSKSVDGTSGTIRGMYYGYFVFQYDYDGITYTWEFDEMDEEEEYGSISEFSLKPGESKDVTVSLSTADSLDSVDINIWDTSILSADPVSFAIADTTESISFDALALKEGTTRIALVFTKKEGNYESSYDRYVQSYRTVTVASVDTTTEWTPGTANLTASFHAGDADEGAGSGSIIEGKTANYNFHDDVTTVYMVLSREGTMSKDYYNSHIEGNTYGYLTHYNGTSPENQENIIFEYDSDTKTLKMQSTFAFEPESITNITWLKSGDLITSGTASVPSLTLTESFNFKPYIKLNRDGLNVSTLEYYFVDSKDNRIDTPAGISALSVKVEPTNEDAFFNEDESGTMAVNLPESAISTIYFSFNSGDVIYDSTFTFAANDEDATVASVTWTDANSDTVDTAVPLFMTVGESRDFSLSNSDGASFADSTLYVGNTAIVSVDKSVAGDSLTLRLTALAAGMTSLTITYEASGTSYVSNPFEIWVAGTDGTIPSLNGTSADIYAQLTSDDLTSGTSGGWNENTASSDQNGSANSEFATTDPVTVLSGLSVNPRYALPTDPSGDLYSNMWDKIYAENLTYGAYMFEDEVEVVASRDVTEVFKALSADLIARSPAQLLAIVLPEITVSADGIYTFRIPTDNITTAGTQIYFYANDSDEAATVMNYYPDSGDELASISGEDYINVAVYLTVGTYTPIFTAAATTSDVNIINGALSPALTLRASTLTLSMDISADSTVTLTPSNVVGTVTYSANQSWVTFSGNVATFRPTATGTYNVVITVRDSSLRTATVTIAVRVTAASTASDDIKPTSPDVPVSPDVRPTSPDQPAPTPDTPDTPESGTPETPTVDVNSPSTTQTILNALRTILNFITGNTEVTTLSEGNATVGTERSVEDVSEEELAQIPEEEALAMILPIMRVQKPAVYVFGLNLTNLRVGAAIFLHMMPQPDTVAAEFTAADDTDTQDAYTFLNDDGEEVTTVPENKHVNIAAYMEPGYTYAPLLTVKESSSEGCDDKGDDKGDNKGDDKGSDTDNRSVGSSGGGCDAGFSFMALAVIGLLMKKRYTK